MLRGSVVTILSSRMGEEIASSLGKKNEVAHSTIYYRKSGEVVRSVLLPPQGDLLSTAESLSLSSSFVLNIPETPELFDGELILLASSSGLVGSVTYANEDVAKKITKGTGLEGFLGKSPEESIRPFERDLGYVSIDRIFNVKGVGTVALGFSFTHLSSHEKLFTLPSKKVVEVKSIQVLDENQEEVGPGTRVGLAIRNLRSEEIEDSYVLLKDQNGASDQLKGKIEINRFSQMSQKFHVVCCGSRALGEVSGEGSVKLDRPMPLSDRYILINMNAKPKTPRVVGHLARA